MRISNSAGISKPLRAITIASLVKIGSPNIFRPAWRSVLPVLTTSAIRSATPRRTLLSTAPSRRTTSADIFSEFRYAPTKPGYAVATRFPEISLTLQSRSMGAANRKVEAPKSSEMSSLAGAPESMSRSRPVIPASSSPEPT